MPRLATTLSCVLSLLLATAGAAVAREPTVTEFETGLTADNGAWGVAAGNDKNLWVTESQVGAIARVGLDGTVAEFGGLMGEPRGIAAAPDGCLWFVEAGGSGLPGSGPAIGHITPDGLITEFTAGLSADAEPVDIALGDEGDMWFTERSPARIGRIDKDGVITEYSAGLTAGSEPMSITAGPDGHMWFTQAGGTGSIGRITENGEITEFTLGLTPSSAPAGIAAGPDGNLWFTEFNNPGAIGRITKYGVITEFSTGLTADSAPMGITVGGDRAVWFAGSSDPGRIGRITEDGEITEHTLGLTPNSQPWRLTQGPDGNVWFTELGSPGRLARITVPPGVWAKDATGSGDAFAKLNAKIATNAQGTEYHFEYGETGEYGAATDRGWLDAGDSHKYVAANVLGLKPATRYHFRLVATNDSGTTYGADRTFATMPTPLPVPPATKAIQEPPPLKPELGEKVVVAPAAGVVRVKVPGRSDYLPLGAGAEIPLGSVIDTRRGSVTLTSEVAADGTRQTGTFGDGLFTVRQRRAGRGYVDLYLRGGSFRHCRRAAGSRTATAAARRRRSIRRLWGRDRGGRFRTHGRNSHATVRGTAWVTVDRCDGTLTRVRKGAVVVRDLVRNKRVLLRAGRSYLARPRR